jgi:hypothetical protein
MPFDLSKLPLKIAVSVSLILAATMLLCVGALSWVSYSSSQPFMVNDKAFGFGSGELAKLKSELSKSSEALEQLREKLTESNQVIAQLRDANAKLIAQQQARAANDAAMWFPVDDVEFNDDGSFSGHDGRRPGRGKWSSPDSELSLRAVELGLYEVVLETNLSPPGNKIRLSRSSGIIIPMDRWEYRLNVLWANDGMAKIRVERRSKVHG